MAAIRSILVHHHATIYTDPATGKRYTYSFIGRWVNELSMHFDKVGLLFHESANKSNRHDTLLEIANITVETLGPPGKAYDRFQKMARVKVACEKVSGNYDGLIIRGMTPRQFIVFNTVKVKFKAYLLVGSIHESKPPFQFTLIGIYMYLMYYVRIRELGKIARNSNLILANSPKVVKEIKTVFSVESLFMPTNTIRKPELRPLRQKEISTSIRLYFCGRIVVDKGIFELLEAVSILHGEGIDCSVTFTGMVSSDLMLEFQSLPYWSKIKDSVTFTGFINFGEALLDLYDAHDLYILPSYHEGFPHSIWEAAALSTPVITTAVGGIPGVLSSDDVWFIPVKDAGAIANTVKIILQSPEMRKSKVESLYKKLLNNTLEAGTNKLKLAIQEN